MAMTEMNYMSGGSNIESSTVSASPHSFSEDTTSANLYRIKGTFTVSSSQAVSANGVIMTVSPAPASAVGGIISYIGAASTRSVTLNTSGQLINNGVQMDKNGSWAIDIYYEA